MKARSQVSHSNTTSLIAAKEVKMKKKRQSYKHACPTEMSFILEEEKL